MNYQFPSKVNIELKSLIREVADKGAQVPNFISFALGSPAPECIPVEELQEAAEEVFSEEPMKVFQYGPLAGDAELIEWIKDRMVSCKGFAADGNSVLMLTGSGKGLALAPRTLCESGDVVFVDDFSYPNALNCMKFAGVIPKGIKTDDYGMVPEDLEKAAAEGEGKWIYLIPNFQNPTGKTMPLQRRKEIYDIAHKYGLLIYEDDPYGEIRFRGEDVPSIKSMDTEGIVIYAGSFSKTISAGLRVGFLYGPNSVIRKLTAVKNGDGQDAIISQRIITRTLGKMDFDEHLEMLRKTYGRKCNLMVRTLQENCPPQCKILIPDGGMFLWIEVPEDVNVDELSDAAIKAGVGVVKSEAFAVNMENKGHAFRLNYSAQSEENIETGCRTFGKILNEYVK